MPSHKAMCQPSSAWAGPRSTSPFHHPCRQGYPFYAVQEFGALERQAGGNALDRMDLFIRARLGRWFPLLLGAQTFAIAVGLLLVAIRLIRRRVKGKRV